MLNILRILFVTNINFHIPKILNPFRSIGYKEKESEQGRLINELNDYLGWLGNQKGISIERSRNNVKHVIYVAEILDLEARIPEGQN